jgi:hypothetical protein
MGTKLNAHQSHSVQALTNKQGHGGNRGLNAQPLMMKMETLCVRKQDKTNGN